MKIASKELIADLVSRTNAHIKEVQQWKKLSEKQLNWKENSDCWSMLECLEHLNRYGDFYIPEMDQKIESSKHPFNSVFRSGILGNYFAKSMLPKEKLNKMNTFKSMNPNGSNLDKQTIDRFLNQQYQLLQVLEKAASANLTKIKTGITISKWIRLRLGDTLRVVIYHTERHVVQGRKVLELNAAT